jgi:hypothetical protein
VPLIRSGFNRSKDEDILLERLNEATWVVVRPEGTNLQFELPGETEFASTTEEGITNTLSTGEVNDNLLFSVTSSKGEPIDDLRRPSVLRAQADTVAALLGGEVILAKWDEVNGEEALSFLIRAGDALDDPTKPGKTRVAGFITEVDDQLVVIAALSTVDDPPGLDRLVESFTTT